MQPQPPASTPSSWASGKQQAWAPPWGAPCPWLSIQGTGTCPHCPSDLAVGISPQLTPFPVAIKTAEQRPWGPGGQAEGWVAEGPRAPVTPVLPSTGSRG